MPERLDEEVRRKGIIRGVPLFHEEIKIRQIFAMVI